MVNHYVSPPFGEYFCMNSDVILKDPFHELRLTPAAVQSAALSTAFALMAEPVGDVRVQWF